MAVTDADGKPGAKTCLPPAAENHSHAALKLLPTNKETIPAFVRILQSFSFQSAITYNF
jgi:hypothetical protein